MSGKRIKGIILLLLVLLSAQGIWAQTTYPVSIQTLVVPPISPYLNRMLSPGGGGYVAAILRNTNANGAQLRIKLTGTLERLSPSPFTISVNPNYQPQQPIVLPANVPVNLTGNFLQDVFANFDVNQLVLQNITLAQLRADGGSEYKLPEGTYRMCFAAYNYDQPGYTTPLSVPNTGCAIFTICYKASAPQLVQPVNGMSLTTAVGTVNPGSPLLFSWTPPALTCGSVITPLSYTLEIHQVFAGQTATDAMQNPPVFMKRGLTTPVYPFDTVLYKDVLAEGKQYAVRIQATAGSLFNNAVTFANNGYSAPQAFQYGFPIVNDLHIITPGIGVAVGTGTGATGTGANCGISAPSNTTPATGNLSNTTLTIAGFNLTPSTITRNNDGTYSGSGTVAWTPASTTLHLSVTFNSIKVNTANQVFSGVVVASANTATLPPGQDFSQFSSFAGQAGPSLDQLAKNVNGFLSSNPASTLISQITGSALVSLPLGLDKQTFGGAPVTLDIMSIVLSPQGATMSVLYSMNVPEANSALNLVGTKLCIEPTGLSLSKGTLMLPADRSFPIAAGLTLTFKGSPASDSTGSTYAKWSGGNLTDIEAHATIGLPRSMVVPEDANGNATPDSVKALLLFSFHDWDDWIASISLPNFQLADVQGLGFTPTGIYYDHSTKQNPPSFNAPSGYTGSTGNDFEGLYVKNLAVLLPSTFQTFNNGGKRTSFAAHDFIVDDNGVSTSLRGYHIIDLSKGSLGGWSFSLDTVKLDVVSNTFTAGHFAGTLKLPVSATPINYTGDMHTSGNGPVQYQFVAQPKTNMTFDLWAATVTLDQNSAIDIGTDNNGTAISAALNGKISLNTGGVNFPSITFNGLGFGNRSNGSNGFSFDQGTWSFASPQKYIGQSVSASSDDSGTDSGFPVTINNITKYTQTHTSGTNESIDVGVKFDIDVTLGDATVISGSANLYVYGTINASTKNLSPPSIALGGPHVQLDTLTVNGAVGPFSVDGQLIFFHDDPKFGNGFKGSVSADLEIVQGNATVQFGKTSGSHGYNYWYIDASLVLQPPLGIPLGSSSLMINGFGGGAFYNMEASNLVDPSKIANKNNGENSPNPGQTYSGTTYVPQKGAAGMMATINIADLTPDILNASVTLTATLNNGSLADIDLKGQVGVLTDGSPSGLINGKFDMNCDFAQGIYSLNVGLTANLGIVTASIPLAIYSCTKGANQGFYFELGDPDDSANQMNVRLSSINTAIFSENMGFRAYLAFGAGRAFKAVFPPLPSVITDALSAQGLSVSQTASSVIGTLNATSRNVAFLFGAEGYANISFNLAVFYASASLIVGFDVELANYQGATCNASAMGWNGWYALGQVYANMSMDVGVEIDVWFFSGKIDLCSFSAGAVLQAGLPNPIWVSGEAYAKGSVLDGLISFDTHFHFTVGNPCYPTPHDPLTDIQIISDYGPSDSCSIFDKPYLASNLGLDRNYDVPMPPSSAHPNGSTRTYKFGIKSYKLTYKKSGQTKTQSITLEYENNDRSVNLEHEATLEPEVTYTATIVCDAKQLVNGVWMDPFVDSLNAYKPMEQTTSFTFKTEKGPPNLPNSSIHYSYPMDKQRYVLKKEFNSDAVLRLNEWPDYLLDVSKSTGATSPQTQFKVYFIDVAGGDTLKTDFTATNKDDKPEINYKLPSGLKNSTVYQVEFWKLDVTPVAPAPVALGRGGSTGANVLTETTRTLNLSYSQAQITHAGTGAPSMQNASSNNQVFTGATIKSASLQNGGKVAPPAPKPLYTMYFGTSRFNTFADKMNAWGNQWVAITNSNGSVQIDPRSGGPLVENFDYEEMYGGKAPDGSKVNGFFSGEVPWDDANSDDKRVTDDVYDNAKKLTEASTQFHSLKVSYEQSGYGHDQSNRPTGTLSWGPEGQLVYGVPVNGVYGVITDPILSATECKGGSTFWSEYAALTLYWNGPMIVNRDITLIADLVPSLKGESDLIRSFRAAQQVHEDYNLCYNTENIGDPSYSANYNGEIKAVDTYYFAIDPAYFKSDGGFSSTMDIFNNAAQKAFQTPYPATNVAHSLDLYYGPSGFSAAKVERKFKTPAYVSATQPGQPSIQTSQYSGPGSSGSTPPKTGTKIQAHAQ